MQQSVLLPSNLSLEDENEEGVILPESISITRIDDLLSQMRFHEVPKRAQFSIPLELGTGFQIGVKGYGLVTEQKKGAYKYFVDLGDRMEVAGVRTVYLDEVGYPLLLFIRSFTYCGRTNAGSTSRN